MRKRLRKKLHLKEFQEFGFEVDAELNQDVTKDQENELLNKLIDFVESHNLCIGGGISGFYVVRYRGSATEEDRVAIETWMKGNVKEIKNCKVGELTDAWRC